MTDRVPAEQVMREMIAAACPDAAPETVRELAQDVADTGLRQVSRPESMRKVAARFAGMLGSGSQTVKPLEFTVLTGLFSLRIDGRRVTLGQRKARAVLLGLLLRGGQASVAQLINDLWGDQPPASARATLMTYVAHLRRIFSALERPELAGGNVLTTIHGGYALNMGLVSSDLQRAQELEQLARRAQEAGDLAVARHALLSALGQFQGRPLAEEVGSFAEAQGHMLDEWRLVLEEGQLALQGQALELDLQHQVLDGTADLTASELLLARMAATGMTTQEIAARLAITRRTVENHLTHIYRKLGISSHQALPEAVGHGTKPPADTDLGRASGRSRGTP
ncbi:LuxR C-terminal-related transcriptional regulator [Streptomyces sp. NPDC021056]|uniref:LuxR C-terminal-related transcriptional regulator n=1 Tax=Streptomyces sp. NPDC021056 TaxID=3155012 RepID=UPI0033C19E3C